MSNPATFTWFPFLGFGWVGLGVIASIIFRTKRGKPIFPKVPPGAFFSERKCSGRSLTMPWARIGGARNCLLVALTPQKLVITPTFPFNLMFLPEIYGLEHDPDISAIREITDGKDFAGRRLAITYANPTIRRMELRLRHHDDFIGELRKLGIPVATT